MGFGQQSGNEKSESWRKNYEEVVWTDEKIKAFWDFESQFSEKYFSYQVGANLVERLYPYFSHAKNALDYGSGPGFLIPHLLKRKINVVALDFSPESVRLINDKFSGKPFFQKAVLPQALNSLGEKFDLVMAVEVIEHLNDRYLLQFLGDIRKWLSPEGVAVFTTPNQEDFAGKMICCPDCRKIFHRRQHVRSFSRDSLVKVLEENSFEVIAAFESNLDRRPTLKNQISAKLEALKNTYLRRRERIRKSPHLVAVAKLKNRS
jgi:2-polyprenyl-3-methyl-5-hydroxy-6-metoxy-1,4-benzoquinol methylase